MPRLVVISLGLTAVLSCSKKDDGEIKPPRDGEEVVNLVPLFSTDASRSCNMASPISHTYSNGTRDLITVAMDGLIRGFDPNTGDQKWSAKIDAPDDQTPILLATPTVYENWMFLAWQNTITGQGLPDQGTWQRVSHEVGVFNLATKQFDSSFAQLRLHASVPGYDGSSVVLQAGYQLQRSAIHHVTVSDRERGLLYVSVGNGPSIQPFHGWVFEIDLDAWHDEGPSAAIAATLLTTAENDCTADAKHLFTMVCGGGVWTPAGLFISKRPDDTYELFIPTGNGRVNFNRKAYANSLLKVSRGLTPEPECNTELCADFDELNPSIECLASCKNIFSARMPAGQTLQPEHGDCDGLSLYECYGRLDADFGASAPVEVNVPNGPRVLVHPAKDGGVYLIDADHMGTLYDREQALPMCGTKTDTCGASWAGQFVTQPVVASVNGDPVVIVSGFMFDRTHPAGVVAMRIVMTHGKPDLQRLWQTPDPETPLAKEAFRRHTGRPLLHRTKDRDYVYVVEPHVGGAYLWVIRADDGAIIQRLRLQNEGARYIKPLVLDDILYIGTCDLDGFAQGTIEAFRIEVTGSPTTDAGVPVDDGGGNVSVCEPGGVSCSTEEYCDRATCTSPGLCQPRPANCVPEGDEVCGCDGVRYDNACEAHREGITVDPNDDC